MPFSSTASLQDLCLFKVVEQFEHYPHKLLACLPPTLRRLLLVHLPIVDICHLANTCVFDGIDIEAIWEHIYQLQIPRYFDSLEGFPASHELPNVKKTLDEKSVPFCERYLSILANMILNRARSSGQFCAQRDYGGFDFEVPPPSLLEKTPVDIVNAIVAGEKIEIVESSLESLYKPDPSEEDDEPDLDEEYGNGDAVITVVSDYEYEYQDRYLAIHCDHERGEHFMEFCNYKETNQRYQYVPPRYSKYINNNTSYRLTDEDAITLLVDKCGFLPEHMTVSATAFSSKLWSPDLLQKFLSGLVSLELFFDGVVMDIIALGSYNIHGFVDSAKETKELLTAVLSNPKPALSSLVLYSCFDPDNYDDEKGNVVTDNHLLVLAELSEIPSTLSPPVSPLCTLKELSLRGKFTASGLNNLGTVISRQQSLTSLSLNMFLPAAGSEYKYVYEVPDAFHDYNMSEICQCGKPFIDALVLYFNNPSFCTVVLKHLAFPQTLLLSLIAGFLGSSCYDVQTLKCEGVILVDDGDVSPRKVLPSPQLALQNKFLELNIRELEFLPTFPSQLFSLPLQLSSLNFSCYDQLYKRSFMNENKYQPHDDCLPILAKNSNFQVKSLSLCQPTSISAESIQVLLKSQELKSLELKLCNNTIDFTDIAEHLLMQLPTQCALEEIKIKESISRENIYHPVPHPFDPEPVKFFANTLFSLPNLAHLTFEITFEYRQGRNYQELIKLMFESWKEKSRGRKLKKFVVTYTCSPHSDEGVEMASEMGLHVNNRNTFGLSLF